MSLTNPLWVLLLTVVCIEPLCGQRDWRSLQQRVTSTPRISVQLGPGLIRLGTVLVARLKLSKRPL